MTGIFIQPDLIMDLTACIKKDHYKWIAWFLIRSAGRVSLPHFFQLDIPRMGSSLHAAPLLAVGSPQMP